MKNNHLQLFFIFICTLAFTGCEEDCTTADTGTLTLKNTKSSTIMVNVKGSLKSISPGSTGTFDDVPSGTCEADITYNSTTYTDVQFANCVVSCETTALQY